MFSTLGWGREILYRFHFTIEQAHDTGDVEEDAGKVLNNRLHNPMSGPFRAPPQIFKPAML
jgi:hypothetical protein